MKGSIWEKIMDHADLPGEPVPGLSVVELSGDRRLLIENHGGILEYGPCCIRIRMKYGVLLVQGDGMTLCQISRNQLVIRGRIRMLELCRRDSR